MILCQSSKLNILYTNSVK